MQWNSDCAHRGGNLARGLLAIAGLMAAIHRPGLGADDIEARGCFVQLRDQAQVPARESGLLKTVLVDRGDYVTESQLLASLEDNEARLSLQLTEIDLLVAQKRATDAVTVEVAQAAVEESSRLTQQARLEQQISQTMAESDIGVRQSVAAATLAKDAIDRANESREKFRSSVSSRELTTLQYELDKSQMDVEQARYDQSLLNLRAGSSAVLVQQKEASERRLKLELRDAELERQIAALTVRQMTTAVEVAKDRLDRQHVTSPLTGVVVDKLKYAGEWVEAGEPVLKVIRLDTLFVDGFVAADLVDETFRGNNVTVEGQTKDGTVTVQGKVVFVSPEVDSVNRQVAVRAEITNNDRLLRPGQSVKMTVHSRR